MKAIEILLVDDDLGDVRLTQEALKDSKLHNTLSVVYDGVEALKFLRKEGEYKDASRPGLILLDLNLPFKSGHEILKEIKEDPDLRWIPVVVLTTSDDENDILASYDLHANCYITKPVDFNRFIQIIKSIEGFWFSIVQLPALE